MPDVFIGMDLYRIMDACRVQEVNRQSKSSGSAAKRKRPYDSTRRKQQAAQTKADVLDAAIRLFSENGWTATTLPMIATEAGVAIETIYSRFGSKKKLLRAAIDVAIAGDQLPVPFVERDEFRQLAQGGRRERIRLTAAIATRIQVRSYGVWAALTEAAAADDDIEAWRAELEANRHLDVARAMAQVLQEPVDAARHDLAWVLLGPDTYRAMTQDRGLTAEELEEWLTAALERLLR